MSPMETVYLAFLIICVILSAFFSSSETAFISLQRLRLQHLVETDAEDAKRVAKLVDKPERLLSTLLLGNNFVNTAAASTATVLAVSLFGEGGSAIVIATLTITAILLVFGEVTPKTFAARNPERVSFLFVAPVEFLSWLFTPLVTVLSWIASGFNKLLGGPTTYRRSLFNEEEIHSLIDLGHREGSVEADEAEMLHAAIEFGNRPVSEVLVPRPEVVAVEKGTTIKDFFELYSKNPLSRFPVYEENMDNVLGILSIKDVLMALARGESSEASPIDDLVRPAYFTPESKPIGELFTEMRDKNYRMCIVIDEYGGTAGVVSLTRLMEEIVGPVGDELTAAEKEFETINEYTFQVDGGMRIEEANEEMELDLPESEDYETLAGFVLHLLGQIPRQGQMLRYKNLKMVITSMRGRKIDEILVTKEKKPATAEKPAQ